MNTVYLSQHSIKRFKERISDCSTNSIQAAADMAVDIGKLPISVYDEDIDLFKYLQHLQTKTGFDKELRLVKDIVFIYKKYNNYLRKLITVYKIDKEEIKNKQKIYLQKKKNML